MNNIPGAKIEIATHCKQIFILRKYYSTITKILFPLSKTNYCCFFISVSLIQKQRILTKTEGLERG